MLTRKFNASTSRRVLSSVVVVLVTLVTLFSPAATASPLGARSYDRTPAPPTSYSTGLDGASVHRLYYAYFGRLPDPSGLRYWIERQVRGTSLDDISELFARSAEFRSMYGAVDDAGFVNLVYLNVLGRYPDRAGFDHWVRELAGGRSRGWVMRQFSDSAEFKAHTGLVVSGTRVALIGDSLMWESGPYAKTMLEDLGYEVELVAHPGSGLVASAQPMDWLSRMYQVVWEFDPDVVIVEFCCNHWPENQPEGHYARDLVARTPAFNFAWTTALNEAVGILTSRGAKLSWVVTPAVADPELNGLVGDLNRISAAAAQQFGFDLIDWEAELTPGGWFQSVIGDQQVRHDDGLHLAPAGARRAAEVTVIHILTM